MSASLAPRAGLPACAAALVGALAACGGAPGPQAAAGVASCRAPGLPVTAAEQAWSGRPDLPPSGLMRRAGYLACLAQASDAIDANAYRTAVAAAPAAAIETEAAAFRAAFGLPAEAPDAGRPLLLAACAGWSAQAATRGVDASASGEARFCAALRTAGAAPGSIEGRIGR